MSVELAFYNTLELIRKFLFLMLTIVKFMAFCRIVPVMRNVATAD